MGRLKVLSSRVSNMIAAGEVVQRPASVVKELMENAVDAGATKVDVVISDAGRTLIQVIDNGSGMSPSDAVLCFERHATSKISGPADLERIQTYGFRGEALASIAAVAQVTLRTRREEDETAAQVVIDGGGTARTSSVSAPTGSNFAVRNLFFNTPARRKFLKSDTVEFKHIVEEFTRVAIPRPEIGFTLSHNGKEVFVLRSAKSLKFRITELLGRGLGNDMVDILADTSAVRISGFVGRPESARRQAGNQYFFVGGRYFRSPYLHKAVMKAYEDYVPEGMNPPYFVFLEVDPGAVDVNIHPTKTEIKFEDDNLIFQVLSACVREAIGRSGFSSGLEFDREGAVSFPQGGSGFEEFKAGRLSPATDFDPSFNPFEHAGGGSSHAGAAFPNEAHYGRETDFFGQSGSDSTASGDGAAAGGSRGSWHGPGAPYSEGGFSAGRQDYGRLFQSSPTEADILLVQGRYIVRKSPSGLMLIHIRRAWERILYERSLGTLSGDGHVTQTALFPVQVQVGVQQRLLFEEHASLLASLGFSIKPVGTDVVEVDGVPEGYSCEAGKVEAMVGDLLLIMSDMQPALEEVMRQKTAAKFAMLGAVNAEAPAGPAAAARLLDTLFESENPEFTPGGRRIVSVLGVDEIDKRF